MSSLREGGALLLVTDHGPLGKAAANLTTGFTMSPSAPATANSP